jgi:sulfate adenylyltransferase subunit 2
MSELATAASRRERRGFAPTGAEVESIHIFRQAAAAFERPVLVLSAGKDSVVLLRLPEKAFRRARFPFPILHGDTGRDFPGVIETRGRRLAELGERLRVTHVQDSIEAGRAAEGRGPRAARYRLQTATLLDSVAEHGFDAAFGGARRDEERARGKERVLSFRTPGGFILIDETTGDIVGAGMIDGELREL